MVATQRNAVTGHSLHRQFVRGTELDVYLMPAAFKVLFIPFTTSTTAMSSAN